MTLICGILFVAACWILFAVGGGLIAVMLHRLAPGYYPGVFPFAAHDTEALTVGLIQGVLQGQTLGVFVGALIAIALGCLRQLGWASAGRALAILLGCAAVFGVIGGLMGWALGVRNPGYYRAVVSGGREPTFNPVDVGIGLGSSQGVILGVVVGGLAVVALAWLQSGTGGPSTMNRIERGP